ncbi:MAG: hypothetical protein KJ648_07390 [Candidatus Omnitrophica bacterium]|nr:hypothetical protein [Candidatus Omnitrophota bacterium]
MSPFTNKPDLDLFPPDPATVAAEQRAAALEAELKAELKRRDSQPPHKHEPEEPAVSLAGANTIRGTIKDLILILATTGTLIGIYYGFKGSVAKAEEGAAANAVAVQVLDRRVNRHDTDLKVIEEKAQLQAQDLDRRFGEVKQGQADMERRVLESLKELKVEIRRK